MDRKKEPCLPSLASKELNRVEAFLPGGAKRGFSTRLAELSFSRGGTKRKGRKREREEEHEGNYTSSSAYRVISNKLDRSQGNGIIAKESSLRMRVAIKPTFSPKKSTNFQFRENE